MHSSTSNSEADFVREIPNVPWRGLFVAVALLSTAAVAAWELGVRAHGFAPTLNDTPDLWARERAKVKPDSLVLIGTSRMLFDMDLSVLEKGLGQRPTQLAIVGSSPFPILEDLATDESFHGTVLLDVVPAMYLAPGGPPVEASQKALHRFRTQNYSQRLGQELGMILERRLAFLKQDSLTLSKLLEKLPIPNRANAQIGPALPPYFYELDANRRARMTAEAAIVGSPLQHRVSTGWLPLFSVPPPPSFIPLEKFQQMMGQAMEARFKDTTRLVAKIQARGGKVVFLRMPVSGPLVAREEQLAPRVATWDRLLRENNVPAIHFAEHTELNAFECPEWSHLSAPDSVEFTRRLVPHLQAALRDAPSNSLAAATGAKDSQIARLP